MDPTKTVFKDVSALHRVGLFPDDETAFAAWLGAAQKSVDNAHLRYFIAAIAKLRDTGASGAESVP